MPATAPSPGAVNPARQAVGRATPKPTSPTRFAAVCTGPRWPTATAACWGSRLRQQPLRAAVRPRHCPRGALGRGLVGHFRCIARQNWLDGNELPIPRKTPRHSPSRRASSRAFQRRQAECRCRRSPGGPSTSSRSRCCRRGSRRHRRSTMCSYCGTRVDCVTPLRLSIYLQRGRYATGSHCTSVISPAGPALTKRALSANPSTRVPGSTFVT